MPGCSFADPYAPPPSLRGRIYLLTSFTRIYLFTSVTRVSCAATAASNTILQFTRKLSPRPSLVSRRLFSNLQGRLKRKMTDQESKTNTNVDENYHYRYYVSAAAKTTITPELPESGRPPRHCQRIIEDYYELDYKPRLNTSSCKFSKESVFRFIIIPVSLCKHYAPSDLKVFLKMVQM